MDFNREELTEIIKTVVESTINTLVDRGLLGKASANASSKVQVKEKSAYSQTEALLFNYNNFRKIIRQKEQEIEDIRKYGVCEKGSVVIQYGGNVGGKPRGIVLDEERVEEAIRTVQKSMETTVQALDMIDKNMAALKSDPYYRILEMRYFEERTQEDIAVEFNCTQQNIAHHKKRLIKELSIKFFPEKAVAELLQ
jgi:RNA polymerase sigma factor (sigma-70 family)